MTIQYRGMRLASITCTLNVMAKQGAILGMCVCVCVDHEETNQISDARG